MAQSHRSSSFFLAYYFGTWWLMLYLYLYLYDYRMTSINRTCLLAILLLRCLPLLTCFPFLVLLLPCWLMVAGWRNQEELPLPLLLLPFFFPLFYQLLPHQLLQPPASRHLALGAGRRAISCSSWLGAALVGACHCHEACGKCKC